MNRSNRFFIFMFSMAFVQGNNVMLSHMLATPSRVNSITTEDGQHAALTSQKPTVIMGYMHHCPHCNHLKPIFDKLANKYPLISFVTINGPALNMHQKVAYLTNGTKKIPGYPTVVAIKNGKIVDMVIGGDKKKIETMIAKLEANTRRKINI